MNKMVIATGVLGLTLSAFAQNPAGASAANTNDLSGLSKQMASRMRSYGGDIIDRRHVKGEFYVVNAQSAANAKLLGEALAVAMQEIKVDAKIVEGAFDINAPTVKGQATLFVIDDVRYPMSLIAPEAKWAVVNVAKLKCDKPAFFEARVKKETSRVTGQLFGAFSNQYETNLFSGVFAAEDLDQILSAATPYEYRTRYQKYLPLMGITPYKVVHYKKACQEGWAPAPTNEYQKAIWDKVHQMPTKPIKIIYDPAKGE